MEFGTLVRPVSCFVTDWGKEKEVIQWIYLFIMNNEKEKSYRSLHPAITYYLYTSPSTPSDEV